MKTLLSSLGWLLFLVLAGVFLLFYNLAYMPRVDRIVRQQNEIVMWTSQVAQVADSLKAVRAAQDTAFDVTLTSDELFGGADNLQLTATVEATLRAYVPTLQGLTAVVEVIGHTDSGPVPARLRDRYPSNWEYSAALAGVVARALVSWGVMPNRVRVVGVVDTRSVGDNHLPTNQPVSRYVEVLVRNR